MMLMVMISWGIETVSTYFPLLFSFLHLHICLQRGKDGNLVEYLRKAYVVKGGGESGTFFCVEIREPISHTFTTPYFLFVCF